MATATTTAVIIFLAGADAFTANKAKMRSSAHPKSMFVNLFSFSHFLTSVSGAGGNGIHI